MGKRKILGFGALVMAAIGFALRETIAVAISKLATAMFRDDFAQSLGAFVTFTLADVLIMALIALGLSSLFWPVLSKYLQTEIERKSLFSSNGNRRVFVDCQLSGEAEAEVASKVFKPVLVDCTIHAPRVGFIDCIFDDGFRVECSHVTFCTYDQLHRISETMPVFNRARFLNSPFYIDHLFITERAGKEICGPNPNGLVAFSLDLAERRPSLINRISGAARKLLK